MPVPYRKLVRCKIPEIIQADGGHPVTRVLDEAGYRQALLDKLAEEAAEAARASTEDLPGELTDVLEVLRALTAATGMSWEPRTGRRQAQPLRRLRRQDLPRISRMRQHPAAQDSRPASPIAGPMPSSAEMRKAPG
jgi:predicted house-cleaning noncanonical NTP pyrophosphatase (MazG superfamily)